MRLQDAERQTGLAVILDAHGVYLSEDDETEINRRIGEAADPGAFALRTCQCGARIDGFDAYFEHLHQALGGSV